MKSIKSSLMLMFFFMKKDDAPPPVMSGVKCLQHHPGATNIPAGQVKLIWKSPDHAQVFRSVAYQVLRSDTKDMASAKCISVQTKLSFIDKNPIEGWNHYWVIPYCAQGFGEAEYVVSLPRSLRGRTIPQK